MHSIFSLIIRLLLKDAKVDYEEKALGPAGYTGVFPEAFIALKASGVCAYFPFSPLLSYISLLILLALFFSSNSAFSSFITLLFCYILLNLNIRHLITGLCLCGKRTACTSFSHTQLVDISQESMVSHHLIFFNVIFISYQGYNGENENEAAKIDSVIEGTRDMLAALRKIATVPAEQKVCFLLLPTSLLSSFSYLF